MCIRKDFFLYKRIYILVFLFAGLGASGLVASEPGVSAQEEHGRNAFVVAFENDMFNRMDWYFSNGNNFALYHSVFAKSPMNRILLPGRVRETDKVYYGLHLRQEIYTPHDLNQDEIQAGDHPYAATLSLIEEKIVNRYDEGLRFTSSFHLGVLGPFALGFQSQNFIHMITPSDPPQGWNNQVSNDLMLNYSFALDKEIKRDELSQFALHFAARLGTVYTDARAGFWVRFEHFPKFFRYFEPDPSRKFNFYARLGAEICFVGYDASLQGGMFNRTSPYTIPAGSISRLVGGMNATAVFELKRQQLLFYQNFVSPRFSQAEWHAWMGISYRYWF